MVKAKTSPAKRLSTGDTVTRMFKTSRADSNLEATSPRHALTSTMAVNPLLSQADAPFMQVDPSPAATSPPYSLPS